MSYDLPTPRYRIGDVVYHPGVSESRARHACPDCGDTRKWRAISAVGEEHSIACPRCTTRYVGAPDDLPTLDYATWAPQVTPLTIGSVTASSQTEGYEAGVRYMCRETGVGSGTVYREVDLYPTQEAAAAAAEILARERQAKSDAHPAATRARHFADHYTLDPAIRQVTWDKVYKAWEVARHYRDILQGALPCEQDEPTEFARLHPKVQEVSGELWAEIDTWERYEWTAMRTPLDALLAAAEATIVDPGEWPQLEAALKAVREALTLPPKENADG